MKKILITSVALGAISFASTASALMVNFDFTNDGYVTNYSQQGFTSEDGSLTLNANAQWKYNYGSTWNDSAPLSWGGSGLWIDLYRHDNHQIDGKHYDERVIFSFLETVTLKSVSFNYVGDNDDFAFWAGSSLSYIGGANIPDAYPNTYTFNGTYTGDQFAIGALYNNDDFKIDGMTVHYDPIPEPATMLLFGTGIAGLAAVGRRRKK